MSFHKPPQSCDVWWCLKKKLNKPRQRHSPQTFWIQWQGYYFFVSFFAKVSPFQLDDHLRFIMLNGESPPKGKSRFGNRSPNINYNYNSLGFPGKNKKKLEHSADDNGRGAMIRSFWGLNFQVVTSIFRSDFMTSAGEKKNCSWSLVAKKYLVFFPCWTEGRTSSDGGGDDDDDDDDGDDCSWSFVVVVLAALIGNVILMIATIITFKIYLRIRDHTL